MTTPSFTSDQIWDSLGLQYEVKYVVDSIISVGNVSQYRYPDTVIFHANNTVTEISDTTIIFSVAENNLYELVPSISGVPRNSFTAEYYPSHTAPYDSSAQLITSNFYKAIFQYDSINVFKAGNTEWCFGSFYFRE